MQMQFAYATLITSDAYLPGALSLCHSIKSNTSPHDVIALCPPNILTSATISQLYRAFDRIIYVPLLKSGAVDSDIGNLELLGRPELDITFTKLHVFNPDMIGSYERVAFLDADSFALRNVDELFNFLDDGAVFAAAADVGWPDIFNSGVFVCRPSKDIFKGLLKEAMNHGSFDAIVHFAGHIKPWKLARFSDGTVWVRDMPDNTRELHDLWWKNYDEIVAKWKAEDMAQYGKKKEEEETVQLSNLSTNQQSANNHQDPIGSLKYEWDRSEFFGTPKSYTVRNLHTYTPPATHHHAPQQHHHNSNATQHPHHHTHHNHHNHHNHHHPYHPHIPTDNHPSRPPIPQGPSPPHHPQPPAHQAPAHRLNTHLQSRRPNAPTSIPLVPPVLPTPPELSELTPDVETTLLHRPSFFPPTHGIHSKSEPHPHQTFNQGTSTSSPPMEFTSSRYEWDPAEFTRRQRRLSESSHVSIKLSPVIKTPGRKSSGGSLSSTASVTPTKKVAVSPSTTASREVDISALETAAAGLVFDEPETDEFADVFDEEGVPINPIRRPSLGKKASSSPLGSSGTSSPVRRPSASSLHK
ncbi:hypothetical protein HDV05_000137 [Chytridiales sp. JEL 0842]|nr:hypothetical protein HDV05_000137 [Chytridiales sp. JEL 0842]